MIPDSISIGDIVRIKTFDELVQEYGLDENIFSSCVKVPFHFTKTMCKCVGGRLARVSLIKDMDDRGRIPILLEVYDIKVEDGSFKTWEQSDLNGLPKIYHLYIFSREMLTAEIFYGCDLHLSSINLKDKSSLKEII